MRRAEIRRDEEEKAVSPVIATILMVAITVVLAGVLYVWANNLASEGTDTSIGTLNTYTTEDANDETGPGADDTLVRMQLTGKDDLAWSFIKITVSVGDNVYTCSVIAGDDCQISQVAGDDDNAWEPGEYLFLSEGTDDICSEAECLLQISVTHNGRTVAGDGVSGQGGNVGSGSGGLTNVNFIITGFDEINSGANAVIGEYGGRVLVGNTLYFDAHEGNAGRELWSHNTVTGQNSLAADIRSGGNSGSNPGHYGGIMAVGTTLYFDANDNIDGNELWAYETTNSSAWQVADINSGSGSSNPGQYMTILVGDTIYFSANDGSSGIELWAHDTSTSSTWRVADIYSGSGHGATGQYLEILVGDTLYFSANSISGLELWAHDTSNSSTWQVADINSGYGHSYPGTYMTILVGDTIYFDADDGSSGIELWAHDISTTSTWRVADINSGGYSYPGRWGMEILVGDTFYFSADDGSSGYELWAHDTSTSSTWRVADINSGSGNANPGYFAGFTAMGTRLYFDADDGSSGIELWAHDTSNSSTWQVADINSGSGDAKPGNFAGFTVMGTRVFFDADDGSNGRELWALDSTNGSTWRVTDINTDGGSHPGRYTAPTVVGNRLYFEAYTPDTSYELWMMEIVTS